MSRPDEILERYRAAQSLDDAHRARLLHAIQSRIAGGAGGANNPPPSNAAPALAKSSVLAKASVLLPKIVLGLAVASGSAAWLATRTPAGDPVLARPPVVLVPSRPTVSPSTTQPSAPGLWPDSTSASAPAPGSANAPPSEPPLAPEPAHAPEPEPAHTPEPEPTPARVAHARTPSSHTASPAEALTEPTTPAPSPAPGAPTAPFATATTVAPPVLLPSPARPSPAESPAPSPTTSPASAGAVDEEVRLVAEAYSFLRDGNASKALAAVEEHERRFPQGKLVESRRVTRILALCQLGRTSEARDERERFLSRYPQSPFSNRVRAACAETGSP
jgi:hypothetical protein